MRIQAQILCCTLGGIAAPHDSGVFFRVGANWVAGDVLYNSATLTSDVRSNMPARNALLRRAALTSGLAFRRYQGRTVHLTALRGVNDKGG